MAGNIFETYTCQRTFWYIKTPINKKSPREHFSLHKQLYYILGLIIKDIKQRGEHTLLPYKSKTFFLFSGRISQT